MAVLAIKVASIGSSIGNATGKLIGGIAGKTGKSSQSIQEAIALAAMVGSVGIPAVSAISSQLNNYKMMEYLRKNEKFPVEIPKELLVIRSIDKAYDHLIKQNPQLTSSEKDQLHDMLAETMNDKSNAFFSLRSEKAKKDVEPSVIVPRGVNQKALAHEVGHYQDSLALKKKTSESFNKEFHPAKSLLYGLAFQGGKSPYYKREAAAWDLGNVSEDEAIRQAALKTYKNYYNQTGIFGLSALLYLLSKGVHMANLPAAKGIASSGKGLLSSIGNKIRA